MPSNIADRPVRGKPDWVQSPCAGRGADTLAMTGIRPAAAGPVHAFSQLVVALADRDQGRVTEARKELRRRGFDVRPLNTPPKGGD